MHGISHRNSNFIQKVQKLLKQIDKLNKYLSQMQTLNIHINILETAKYKYILHLYEIDVDTITAQTFIRIMGKEINYFHPLLQ